MERYRKSVKKVACANHLQVISRVKKKKHSSVYDTYLTCSIVVSSTRVCSVNTEYKLPIKVKMKVAIERGM